MVKSSAEIEREFIDNLMTISGKNLKEWIAEIDTIGLSKRNEIVNWLKQQKDFGHMNATLLAGIYLNQGKPVYADQNVLLENQLSRSESMRPLFDVISREVLNLFPDAQLIPKKTYISFTAVREFAAINVKSREIRLGMDLGDVPYKGILEKSKLTGPMSRISHMVTFTNSN